MKNLMSGKLIIQSVILLLLMSTHTVMAEKVKITMLIYKSDALLFEKDVEEIDSVKFYKPDNTNKTTLTPEEEMRIYVGGVVHFKKYVSEIDSVIFLRTIIPSPLLLAGALAPTTRQGCSAESAPSAATTIAELQLLPGTLVFSEGCSNLSKLTISHNDVESGSCPIIINRTYTVKDSCNSTVSIVHKITIQDTTPPVISGTLPDIIIQACPNGFAPLPAVTINDLESLSANLSINDACTARSSLKISPIDAYSGNCPRYITRTYSVIDECNNVAKVVQKITIQ